MKTPLLAAACLIAAFSPVLNVAARAQSTSLSPQGRPDPLHAEAAVPLAQYRLAFTGYRPLAEETVMPWKETNDSAGRIGGWRAYARQAQELDPAAPAEATPGTTPTAPGGLKPMPGHMMQ